MGRGDRRTKRGKIWRGTSGKVRNRKRTKLLERMKRQKKKSED